MKSLSIYARSLPLPSQPFHSPCRACRTAGIFQRAESASRARPFIGMVERALLENCLVWFLGTHSARDAFLEIDLNFSRCRCL